MCKDDTAIQDGSIAEREQMMNKQDTLTQVQEEAVTDEYPIGCCIDSLIRMSVMDKIPDYLDVFHKHKVVFYFLSTIANVCRGDSDLSKEERDFMVEICKQWGVTDQEQVKLILEGINYYKEFVYSATTAIKEAIPDASDEDIEIKVERLKYNILMYSLIAATQDGLVRHEYNQCKKLAIRLGLTEDVVTNCVEVIKLEKQFYHQCAKVLKF